MKTQYYKLSPEQIFKDVLESKTPKKIQIKDREFFVYPGVYPSDKFRTTDFLLSSIEPLVENAVVCDMGCGMGIVGLFALQRKARRVVQVDVNPLAVENAKANRALYQYSDGQAKIFQSDCFDDVPKELFDVIIFNAPFHSESHEIINPLEYAFYDPDFVSMRKFLSQVVDYSHDQTDILIAFSSKGDVPRLERYFDEKGFVWELWKIANTHQEYDNRIYKLHMVKK